MSKCGIYGTGSADRSGLLFLRKLWKWTANHSCVAGARQNRKSDNGKEKQRSFAVTSEHSLYRPSKNSEKPMIQTGLRDWLCFFGGIVVIKGKRYKVCKISTNCFPKKGENVLQQTAVSAQCWEMTASGNSPHISLHVVSVAAFVCPLSSVC